MNGSVYISFFQGQLEPVLEQVVQLAVQEISKTVGSSLNSMLLETAVKERENQQLKLQLQSRDSAHNNNGCPVPAGGKAAVAAADRASSGSRTKLEPLEDSHAPVYCSARGLPADARRLEQKGRVVGKTTAHYRYTHTHARTLLYCAICYAVHYVIHQAHCRESRVGHRRVVKQEILYAFLTYILYIEIYSGA